MITLEQSEELMRACTALNEALLQVERAKAASMPYRHPLTGESRQVSITAADRQAIADAARAAIQRAKAVFDGIDWNSVSP